jgi:hypothetical protein
MSKKISLRAISRAKNRRQAYVLILLGAVCLALALLLHPSTRDYPVGVLLFGLGMSIATILNPYRLASASLLTTLLGIAVYLAFKPLIPGNQILADYILAVGLALLGIALMARGGYIKVGAVTPGLLVVGVGIIEYLLAAGYTPSGFIPFMLSFWLPGVGLLVVGILYLVTSGTE